MKGMELCGLFYEEAVQPLLTERFPDLVYSSARLGKGSDVLGFDTPTSMDHDWGPQLDLFLGEADYEKLHQEISNSLATELPLEIRGHSTNFEENDDNTAGMEQIPDGPVNHRVSINTLSGFFENLVGFDPAEGISAQDWLRAPAQELRSIASGSVFHDGLGKLERIRADLHWYPDDLWFYLMACQWRRIAQEEPFMARCGDTNDELGSQIVGMRLMTELMRVCFLIERQYPPYFKWFGTAFSKLDCSDSLSPIFQETFKAEDWKTREKHLSQAYCIVADLHNRLEITDPEEPSVSPFHSRPYLVPHADRFASALYNVIQDSEVADLPRHIGAIWQFADSTDILTSTNFSLEVSKVYKS